MDVVDDEIGVGESVWRFVSIDVCPPTGNDALGSWVGSGEHTKQQSTTQTTSPMSNTDARPGGRFVQQEKALDVLGGGIDIGADGAFATDGNLDMRPTGRKPSSKVLVNVGARGEGEAPKAAVDGAVAIESGYCPPSIVVGAVHTLQQKFPRQITSSATMSKSTGIAGQQERSSTPTAASVSGDEGCAVPELKPTGDVLAP